jgi:hypothetical protein
MMSETKVHFECTFKKCQLKNPISGSKIFLVGLIKDSILVLFFLIKALKEKKIIEKLKNIFYPGFP